jgi:hypothetical protein
MKTFNKITLLRILILLHVLFLTSCTSTPDIRLSVADMTMELKESAYRITSVAVSPDGRYVVSGDMRVDVMLWDILNGKMLWKINGHKMTAGGTAENWVLSTAITSDGKKLLSGGSSDNLLKIWDINTGKILNNLEGHEGSLFLGTASIHSIAVSSDGKKAVTAGGDKTVRLWDLEKGVLIKTFRGHEGVGWNGHVFAVDMSPDGKYSLSGGGDGTVRLWDNATGNELLKIEAHTSLLMESVVNSVAFAKNDMRAFSGGEKGKQGKLKFWDLKTGNIIRESEKPHDGRSVKGLKVSHDGKCLLSTDGDTVIRLWDIDTGGLLKTYKGYGGFRGMGNYDAVIFHPDGKRFISGSSDASVRITDLNTGLENTLMVSFPDNEWLVITSEGYYNASEKGAEYLSVIVDDKTYDMNLFYDVFYRPDIVAAKLRGEDIKDLITITMKDAIKSPPPLVEIKPIITSPTSPKAKVCYNVKSTGGGIGEVRLFHNGKLIESDGYYKDIAKTTSDKTLLAKLDSKAIYEDMRNVKIKEKAEISPVTTKTKGEVFNDCKEIDAISGENEISITAFNKDNTVQSYMQMAKFNSTIKPEEPHLYILSIGIDNYKDNSVNLKYAAKDSTDIKEKILTQAKTLYKPENIHYELITNNNATKANITNKINELSKKIKPTDSFILFVAGHGVLLQNQYYMLTHEYEGKVNESAMISSNEIVEMSKKIKSLSQLFIFDTCHAGGVDAIVSGLYDARMSVLAKKMGLHIYASANSIQQALDGYQDNGLFTYTLLDGLNNKKEADKNKDSKISLVELGEYSKHTTTEISKKLGHAQTPLIINFGKDNAVYLLK